MGKQRENPSLKEFAVEYQKLQFSLNRFSKELSRQIHELLRNQNIVLGFPIQDRVKSWSSIEEKIERLSFKAGSIADLQDLVGLRIILLFSRDVQRTCELVTKKFNVIRQYDTQERLGEDRFGYSSIHFVIKPPEQWLAVPTMVEMCDLVAELQVRTVAQHIWSEASQTFQYKQETNVPVPIRRSIARISAILEIVDLEFDRVLQHRDEYREGIMATDTNEPLNVDVLEKTLDDLLPPENKSEKERYSELFEKLTHHGIRDQASLRTLVNKHLQTVLEVDAEAIEAARESLSPSFFEKHPQIEERMNRGIWFIHTALVMLMLEIEFPDG